MHIIAPKGSFENKTIIVSGAAGALGQVICAALGDAGANVVLNDIRSEELHSLLDSMVSKGHRAFAVHCPASKGNEIVERTITTFGSVHAVINATLGPIPWKPFEDLVDSDFQSALEANVLGPLHLIRAAWPHLKAQRYGRVVNFTSDSVLGMPTASAYTLTKGALFGLNKTLAMEGAAHNITVNCVSPIAFRPQMEPAIASFSEEVKEGFRTLYTPEANVPMILALVSEGCKVSGEVFQTAGWAVGRSIWGTVEGESKMETVADCLERVNVLCKKGDREVFEPSNMVDFTEFQAKYVLRR